MAITLALDDRIKVISLRLKPCDVPLVLSRYQMVLAFQVDYDAGLKQLARALGLSPTADERGQPQPIAEPQVARPTILERQPTEPEMILIRAGEFLMGSDPLRDKEAQEWEQPQHTVYLPDYYIAKTPVTNAQYLDFVEATGQKSPDHWEDKKPPKDKEDHPVVGVTWHQARTYCKWLAEAIGKPYRLPSEAEWEKAARGGLFLDGDSISRIPNPYPTRLYPWGPEWDQQGLNSKRPDTTTVGAYPKGASPYGLLDMAGNVWEWTLSLWGKVQSKPDFKYPYESGDGRENMEANVDSWRVTRGGSWFNQGHYVRCAFRGRYVAIRNAWDHGFRVCVAAQ